MSFWIPGAWRAAPNGWFRWPACRFLPPIPLGLIPCQALLLVLLALATGSCTESRSAGQQARQGRHADEPFLQDYAIRYALPPAGAQPLQVACDRNGVVQVLSSRGLLRPEGGALLAPGTLVADQSYLPLADKKLAALTVADSQFVYLDQQAVLSNAWAGKLYLKHGLPGARLLAAGKDFSFLVSDGKKLQYLSGGKVQWQGPVPEGDLLEVQYDAARALFWLLGPRTLQTFTPGANTLKILYRGRDLTCLGLDAAGKKLLVGTSGGYLELDPATGKQQAPLRQDLPVRQLTSIREIGGQWWFGSEQGAFRLKSNGRFDYYAGERWLPGNRVVALAAGPGRSVLVLTDQGLAQICFQDMTLHEKALFFEKQVRQRHLRYGFNATRTGMVPGQVNTGRLSDSDNDGLWTAMYLGGQAFRYAVTQSAQALQNCRESLQAMERLYTIHPVPGFPARSFARSGYIPQLADPERWQHAPDPGWDWKATTSSDEAIGHIFAFGVLAELGDEALKKKAVLLMDTLMQHIVQNDLYLVDHDGMPTTWGRWNPAYVNNLPQMVGDRKLNSSNIIAMLQTAYHFTRKPVYRDKAFELMQRHGYLRNLMRPMSQVGRAPAATDDYSKMLSEGWNHSDDEMYFLGYWGLYRYAFNDTLRQQFKTAILDHWQAERPEKEGAWNIFTALTGTADFDLEEAVWYLQEYPLDLTDWTMKNSHRKDLGFLAPNFRGQSTREVLPPDELKISRHNANRFVLDGGGKGTSEFSAGDIWLLPYWMGRYLQVIGAPGPSPQARL
ncbi:MAG: hypothetical protein ACO1O1_04165 [Adhaeribacter sp.]